MRKDTINCLNVYNDWMCKMNWFHRIRERLDQTGVNESYHCWTIVNTQKFSVALMVWENIKGALWLVKAVKKQKDKRKGHWSRYRQGNKWTTTVFLCPLDFILAQECTIHHRSERVLQTNWNSKIFNCPGAHTLSFNPCLLLQSLSLCFSTFSVLSHLHYLFYLLLLREASSVKWLWVHAWCTVYNFEIQVKSMFLISLCLLLKVLAVHSDYQKMELISVVCNVRSSEYLLRSEYSMLWHGANIFTVKLIRQMTGGLAITKWQIFLFCVPARLIVRLLHF